MLWGEERGTTGAGHRARGERGRAGTNLPRGLSYREGRGKEAGTSPVNSMGQGLGVPARTQGLQLLHGGQSPAPPEAHGPRASGVDSTHRPRHRTSWRRGGAPPETRDLGVSAQRPGTQACGPFPWGCRRPAPLQGLRRPLSSPPRSHISLPSTLSKSSKFSDRIIFQLPEKLGMVATPVAVLLDPSAGALDVESFSREGCGRRLRPTVRPRKPDTSQDSPEAGAGSRAGNFYTLRGPAPARGGGPAPAHLGGPEPRPCIATATPLPRPVDLVPRAGPGFAGGRDGGWMATGGGGRASAATPRARKLGSRVPPAEPRVRFEGSRPFPV